VFSFSLTTRNLLISFFNIINDSLIIDQHVAQLRIVCMFFTLFLLLSSSFNAL
jgi:hypothetical protein